MGGRILFGELVGAVHVSSAPVVNLEFSLADTIANPIKTHVNGFGKFLFDSVGGNATSSTGCNQLPSELLTAGDDPSPQEQYGVNRAPSSA